MQIPNSEAVLVVDTGESVMGFCLINNDAANVIQASGDQFSLNSPNAATGNPPVNGRPIPAGGGIWQVERFSGKMYAITVAAGAGVTARLTREIWHCDPPSKP